MKFNKLKFGNSKPRKFQARSVVHSWYADDQYVGDYAFIELPDDIRKEYTKGIPDYDQSGLTCGMQRPSIELGEVSKLDKGGNLYDVSIEPVDYYDNGGTYCYKSKCVVTPLDGGVIPEKQEALIAIGYYLTDEDGNTRKCSDSDDVPAYLWIPILIVGAWVLFSLI